MDDFGFKFPIGKVVRHIGAPVYSTVSPRKRAQLSRGKATESECRFVVLERILNQCADGVQREYSCRGVLRCGNIHPQPVRFYEAELVASTPFAQEPDEPATEPQSASGRPGGAAPDS